MCCLLLLLLPSILSTKFDFATQTFWQNMQSVTTSRSLNVPCVYNTIVIHSHISCICIVLIRLLLFYDCYFAHIIRIRFTHFGTGCIQSVPTMSRRQSGIRNQNKYTKFIFTLFRFRIVFDKHPVPNIHDNMFLCWFLCVLFYAKKMR